MNFAAVAAERLLLAMLLSGILGLERERKGRSAGLRTHMLVCLGSTLLMLVGEAFSGEATGSDQGSIVDKGRIAAGIITGVGFLGAGSIIQQGSVQHGLTTAATIWFSAALGVVVGAGYNLVAVLATAIALFVVLVLWYLEHWLPSYFRHSLVIRTEGPLDDFGALEDLIAEKGYRVIARRYEVRNRNAEALITFGIETKEEKYTFPELAGLLLERFEQIRDVQLER